MYDVQKKPNILFNTLKNEKKWAKNPSGFVFRDDASKTTHSYVSSISPLLNEYDFISELIKSKTAKYDKCDENTHFSFIKDSLTLISTKLNAIEEENNLNLFDAKVQCENSLQLNFDVESRNNITMDKFEPEITAGNSFGFYSGPRKLISESSLKSVSVHSGLQLSCSVSVSNSTIDSSVFNMEDSIVRESKLVLTNKVSNLKNDIGNLKLLKELLNITNASLPLYQDSTLEFDESSFAHKQSLKLNKDTWVSDMDKIYHIELKTRSQQTENTTGDGFVNKLFKNNDLKKQKLNNDNITVSKQISQNIMKNPQLKLNNNHVRKQKITNSGDFSDKNKSTNRNKMKIGNNNISSTRKIVNVLNRSTLNRKCFATITNNVKKVENASFKKIPHKTVNIVNETNRQKLPTNLSRIRENNNLNSYENALGNVSLELRKNYCEFRSNQSMRNLAKNFKNVIKDFDVKKLNRMKNFERNRHNNLKIDESVFKSRSNETENIELQLKQSKTDLNHKTCIEDPTKSIIKIVLNNKTKGINQNSDSDLSNYRLSSVNEEDESDDGTFKSDSKVFTVDSSVFFSNAYKVYKQQKDIKETKQNFQKYLNANVDKVQSLTRQNVVHTTTLSCKNIKLKQSDLKVDSGAYISNVGTECEIFNATDDAISKSPKGSEVKALSSYSKMSSKKVKDNKLVETVKLKTPAARVNSCVLIYDQINPINNTKIFSNTIDFCSQIQSVKIKPDVINGKSISYSHIQHVPKLSNNANESKSIKHAQVNTHITMKKNPDISQLNKSIKICDYDKIVNRKNSNECNSGLHETLENIIKCDKKSTSDIKTLSDGSSMTFYQPTHLYNEDGKKSPMQHNRTFSADKVGHNKLSSIEQLNSRKFSSEQVIRKISNTSNLSTQLKYRKSGRHSSGTNNCKFCQSCSRAENFCTSLYINNSKNGGSTVLSPVTLSEADSIGTFLSNHQYSMKIKKTKSCEMENMCKKRKRNNTTEDVIAKIKNLPFMGYECNWQSQSNDLWQFTLLNSRLSLIFRLDPREDSLRKTEFERRIASIGLQKYVKHRKRNSLNAIAVKFVSETIRYYITTRILDRIGVIPYLLARCVDIVKQGTKWEKEMHDTKIRLLYELNNNDVLTMKVNHQTLNATWLVSMRLELQKEANKLPWPEAKDVHIVEIATDQAVARCELTTNLKTIKQDWNHVHKTIWTIYEYLKCVPKGIPKNVASNGVLSLYWNRMQQLQPAQLTCSRSCRSKQTDCMVPYLA